MWEYISGEFKFKSHSELIKILNDYGRDNWEIIHYVEEKPDNFGNGATAKVLFKRFKT
jgi:hypothetical protein